MPAVEAMKTMRPHFFARMLASAGCTEKNAPVRLTLRVSVQSAAEIFSAGALWAPPALATTMSNFPRARPGMVVELRERFLVRHVRRFRVDIFMARRRGIELLPAPPTNRDDRACFRQCQRNRSADAAAAAGDECVFAADAHGHTAVAAGSPLPEIR